MSVPPIDLNAIMLAAQVTKVLNVIHRVAYALVSPERYVLHASPNFYTVLSEPAPSFLGRPIEELIWEFVGAEESLEAIVQKRLPFLAFERINRLMPDGRITYLDINVTPVNNAELESGLLIIVEDVTDQAQLEQRLVQDRNELYLLKEQISEANKALEKLSQLKSMFLSMAAHDLRTPLTTIRAYSDLILRQFPSETFPNLARFTEVIQKQAIRMDWLIDDFLDLDLLEKGKLSLLRQTADLNTIVTQVAGMLYYMADRRQQTLSLHLSSQEIMLLVDENRLQQILYNLVTNAIKYTPTGGSIHVYTWIEGRTAVIQVSDTGQGMTAEQQASAFDLYYRSDAAYMVDTTGRGLGLYIVKMLTEAHGGTVELESKLNQGSTFRVFLPM